MPATYSREDVQTHSDHFGPQRPAVNVKVHQSLREGYEEFCKDEGEVNAHFTLDWIERHVSDERLDDLFWLICEDEWGQIKQDAKDIFGPSVTVWSEGRSGGWAVVDGLDDPEEWDAIALAKWRRFERLARGLADSVMTNVVGSIYINEFDQWVRA